MTNLPIITSNNSQPPARGASGDAQLRGSDSPAASATATSSAQKDDTTVQPADPFGAVLARKIQTDEANASDSNVPPSTSGTDTNTATAANSSIQVDVAEQDAAAAIPNDLSGTLVAMLQLPQEIKSPIVKDVTAKATAKGMIDTVTAARGMIDTLATTRGAAGLTAASETSNNKDDINQPAADAGAIQTKMGFGVATAATTIADNSGVAGKLDLRNASSLEITVPVELPGTLQDAARSAQGISQSAASIAASGMLSNILTNNKTGNNPQTIASPLGSSGWANEFSQKITWMGTQQNQAAELHLNPPNLGPLDVVLKISDNQATALFTSPHSAVRDAVESALPRLREMLADNGITLGNTTVSDQSPRDRSTNEFMNQGSGAKTQRDASDDTLRALSSSSEQTVPARRHNGMVDTFA
jgi:flagellar hook-length control protein FliK